MKKLKKFLFAAFTVAILSCLFCQPAFAAISESDVQTQVDAVGKEAVSGNVFIWFLCAIGFLKVGQKIDSFLSSLGVNVGHTGGSMLAEAMIAARGIGGMDLLHRPEENSCMSATDGRPAMPMSVLMSAHCSPWGHWRMAICATNAFWPIVP